MTAAVKGFQITDTDPFTSGYSVATESDRDIDKYGQSNPFAVVAHALGDSLQGNGTYSITVSRGTSNCIALTDLHFLLTGTARVAGTPYP
jgi:hypothetical protein